MSSSLTSRLGLIKPTPGTGEAVNVATHINQSYDILDDVAGAKPCTSGTRPPTPFQGQLIYETDTGVTRMWNGTAWVFAGVGAVLTAVRSANKVLNNNATIQDDGVLQMDVVANATYLMEGFVIYNSPVAADLNAGWTVPGGGSGSTFDWVSQAPSQAHTGSPVFEGIVKFEQRAYNQTQGWGGTGGIVVATPRGLLKTGASGAGSFRFRWAQATATVGDTTVYSGSWLSLRRIA